MLPFHASASPQLSTHNIPHIAHSIKVCDPCNVLAPRSPPHSNFHRSDLATDAYLICHGECHMSLRPDLLAGRCPAAALTPTGALAVFLKFQGVRFNAVYTSPLDRVRATAMSIFQELQFSEEEIQPSDALVEMSQGHWEGCQKSAIFAPEMVSLMERTQCDFSAPSGESLRQITISTTTIQHIGNHFSTGTVKWRFPRKKSGKSRLQIVSSSGDHEADGEMSSREPPINQGGLVIELSHVRSTSVKACMRYSCIGNFSHLIRIKCLVMGMLGFSPVMMDKICTDDCSVTMLQHSWKLGFVSSGINL